MSQCFGRCEKIWILFPPTSENLAAYANTVGFDRRFAKVGSKLHGGIIIKTTQAEALILPSGALHITCTTAGGFLGGIMFSVVETLPTMSRVLVNHLPVLTHIMNQFREDLETYTRCLDQTLAMGSRELLPHVLRSWIDLSSKLENTCKTINPELFGMLNKSLSALNELWESFVTSTHHDFNCPCGTWTVDIGDHVRRHHIIHTQSMFTDANTESASFMNDTVKQ